MLFRSCHAITVSTIVGTKSWPVRGPSSGSGSLTGCLLVEGGHPASGREGWPRGGGASNSTTAGDGGQGFGARSEATPRCVLGVLLNRIVPLLPNYRRIARAEESIGGRHVRDTTSWHLVSKACQPAGRRFASRVRRTSQTHDPTQRLKCAIRRLRAQSARGVRFARLFTVDLGGRAFAHSGDRRYYPAGEV